MSIENIDNGMPVTKKAKKTVQPSDMLDSLGMHSDVQVMDIDNISDPRKESLIKSDPTADIKFFFTSVPSLPGQTKVQMRCNLCVEGHSCPKKDKILTNEHTTLHHHVASLHSQCYRKWCEQNSFDSMLPDDAKECKQAVNDKNSQLTVTDHFKLETEEDKPIVYSNKVFVSTAIKWLINADLPLQVFTRPSFKRMVDIASRANCSVKLPSLKQMHSHIIQSFKQHVKVSPRMSQKRLRFGDDVGKREFIKFTKKYHQQLEEECTSVGRITVHAMSPPRLADIGVLLQEAEDTTRD